MAKELGWYIVTDLINRYLIPIQSPAGLCILCEISGGTAVLLRKEDLETLMHVLPSQGWIIQFIVCKSEQLAYLQNAATQVLAGTQLFQVKYSWFFHFCTDLLLFMVSTYLVVFCSFSKELRVAF